MLHLSVGQWVFYGVLSVVWAFLGYRLSENDRKMLGRTPWGLPSMLWAFFWFLSLILGLVLYLIAHSVGVRQAQRNPPAMGAPGSGPPPPMGSRTPGGRAPTASDLFPAYPRPANSTPAEVEVPTGRRAGCTRRAGDPGRRRPIPMPPPGGRVHRRPGIPTRVGGSTTGGGTGPSGRRRSRPTAII